MRLEVLLFAFFVALIHAQRIDGIPCQVCGSQTFDTTYETSESITFQVASSSPDVIVSPNSVTYTSTNSPAISITCSGTGAAEITFTSSDASDEVRIYCAGLINVLNPPKTILRNSEFELDMTLSPTPVDTVNVIVESLSSLITPGSERVVFGVEQSITNEIFYVPEANIGTAELLFRSRSLRDYTGPGCEALSISIDVQGTMTSSLNGATFGAGTTNEVTIFVDVTAPFDQVIEIFSLAGDAPASIILPARMNQVSFDYTVTASAFSEGACATFSSQYYVSLTDCFSVIGTLTTDIERINTDVVESFVLTLIPQAIFGNVAVNVVTSPNVSTASVINIPVGIASEEYQMVGLEAGDAWIEFSADGYVSQRFDFVVVDIECDPDTEILSLSGYECLTCPSTNGIICGNNGFCTTSSFASESARCLCSDDFFGPQCEFNDNTDCLEVFIFTSSESEETSVKIPATFLTTITIPSNLIQDGFTGTGAFYLQPYKREDPFFGAIDPSTTLPVPELAEKTAVMGNTGFNFDITAADNTALHSLIKPVEFFFEFNSRVVSQKDFLQQVLYYWQPSSASWVPASSVCSAQFVLNQSDLLSMTYRTNLCATGQYQFFNIVPIAPHTVSKVFVFPDERFVFDDLAEYYPFVGVGGVAVEEPPQPSFPIEREVSSTSTTTESDSYSTSTETIKASLKVESSTSDLSSSSSSFTYNS